MALHREAQHRTVEQYRHTTLTDQQADHAIMNMFRADIINLQRIGAVLDEWEEPTFDEFRESRSAWRLFNAATFVLAGRTMDNPAATPKLHQIIDSVCETVSL